MGIRTYEASLTYPGEMRESPEGEYVEYDTHAAEVARLQAEIDALTCKPLVERIATLQDEVARLVKALRELEFRFPPPRTKGQYSALQQASAVLAYYPEAA